VVDWQRRYEMPVVKLNVSLESEVAKKLKRRATEKSLPTSRYLAELIEADDKAAQDALAEVGYRLLSQDGVEFAEAALPLALETWPAWTGEEGAGAQEPETR
jgi:hypothetical protein